MYKIYNNLLPFKGFLAMTIFPFIFIRKDLKNRYNQITDNHESIHAFQQLELLGIFFYILYGLEFIIKLIIAGDFNIAYRSVSFEREAYYNEYKLNYLKNRKWYSWIKYIWI